MLKIAIVEDNNAAAERLRDFLERFAAENKENFDIVIFGDAVSFLAAYRPIYDMIFMDIELPGMNGMEAARRLRMADRQVLLIFVTNMAGYAVKGYEVEAMDYLLKPLHYGDFEMKLRRALSRCLEMSEAICIARQGEVLRLLLKEIYYIEVQGHKLIFHTGNGHVNGSGTLLETEERLKGKGFLRCNKCYLVNQKHIAAVQGYTLIMNGGDKLQISRPRKKSFMSELAETMGNGNLL